MIDREKGQIEYFNSVDAFVKGLAKVPKGLTITRVGKCGAPFTYGIHKSVLEKVRNGLQERELKLTPAYDEMTICVCETRKTVFFKKAPNAESSAEKK